MHRSYPCINGRVESSCEFLSSAEHKINYFECWSPLKKQDINALLLVLDSSIVLALDKSIC